MGGGNLAGVVGFGGQSGEACFRNDEGHVLCPLMGFFSCQSDSI